MMAFEMVYKKVKVENSLTLFRHFYHMKRTGGFYYVCERSLNMDFLARNKSPVSGWRSRLFIVKSENFPKKMEWKEGSGSDLKPNAKITSLNLERLELVKLISLTSVKSTQLEEAGLWVRPSEPLQGEDSGSASRVGEGIVMCLRVRGEKYNIDCVSV